MELELLQQQHLKKVTMILKSLREVLDISLEDVTVELLSLIRYECSSHISILEKLATEYQIKMSELVARNN